MLAIVGRCVLDVRDLGGHLDTTYRGRAGTLAHRIPPVKVSCKAAGSLPLGFRGILGLLRSKCIPAALRGVESSHVSDANLNSLRTAFVSAAWSARMPLAHPGAVLSLLDGPDGCDLAYVVVWFRFRLLRRYLAFRPGETVRIYRMLAAISTGVRGHGPIHLLLASAAKIGFVWNSDTCVWTRPGLPSLHILFSPWQVIRSSILQAWRNTVFADLCKREGFRGVVGCSSLFDWDGSLKLLLSSHVRERDKALLRAILVGGVWNGFLLGRMRGEDVPCRFCGGVDGDGHLFWECSFPPLVELRNCPEFLPLVGMNKVDWTRFMLWHGWLPGLSGQASRPWAWNVQDVARYRLDSALGCYDPDPASGWSLDEHFDATDVADSMPDDPNIWSDGSCVTDDLADVSVAGSGVFFH